MKQNCGVVIKLNELRNSLIKCKQCQEHRYCKHEQEDILPKEKSRKSSKSNIKNVEFEPVIPVPKTTSNEMKPEELDSLNQRRSQSKNCVKVARFRVGESRNSRHERSSSLTAIFRSKISNQEPLRPVSPFSVRRFSMRHQEDASVLLELSIKRNEDKEKRSKQVKLRDLNDLLDTFQETTCNKMSVTRRNKVSFERQRYSMPMNISTLPTPLKHLFDEDYESYLRDPSQLTHHKKKMSIQEIRKLKDDLVIELKLKADEKLRKNNPKTFTKYSTFLNKTLKSIENANFSATKNLTRETEDLNSRIDDLKQKSGKCHRDVFGNIVEGTVDRPKIRRPRKSKFNQIEMNSMIINPPDPDRHLVNHKEAVKNPSPAKVVVNHQEAVKNPSPAKAVVKQKKKSSNADKQVLISEATKIGKEVSRITKFGSAMKEKRQNQKRCKY